MVNQRNKLILAGICLLCMLGIANAQEKVIDRIVAVVGNNYILQSDLETEYQQMMTNQEPVDENTRCKIMEELLYQKLLLAQAQKDSLDVSEGQVEQELDRRMKFYLQKFGNSEERFADFYGKSSEDFKADYKDDVRDLLLEQQMQSKITGDLAVTPNEVKEYFNSIPPDSIPFINAEVEIGQIVKKPVISLEAKKAAKAKIEEIRQRVLSGKASFGAMAALYSMDPGSASKGGVYEHIQRGQFVPEWDAWAFKLKKNEISEVFETVYGYFFIQLIERRGEEVDARSLLIAPEVDASDMVRAKMSLDSVYAILLADTATFSDVAARHSDDEETRNNGGLIINPFTGSTRFQMDEIGQYDQSIAFEIDKLKVKEFSKPMPARTPDGKEAYRILYLKTHTQPHKANLGEDYQAIQAAALSKKQQEAIQQWIRKKSAGTYVHIADDYKNCTFNNKWIN
jgi:peptidyl-prolyl cis-trans isomerase SurA